jgi:hypothetical protein
MTMTSKERVRTTLRHEEPDRVPVGEHEIEFSVIEEALGRPTFYRAKAKYDMALWEGRRDEVVESSNVDYVEFVQKCGLDIAWTSMVPGRQQEIEKPKKVGDNTWEDMRGNILKLSKESADILMVKAGTKTVSPEEAERFAPKNDDESRWEYIDYVVEKLGATHYIVGAMSCDTIWYPSGFHLEPWLLRMVEDPEAMAADEIKKANGLQKRVETLLHRGCDAVILGYDYGTEIGPFMSPDTFRQVLYPGLKAECEAVRAAGSPVVYHACGNNRLILDDMVEAGIDVWQSIQLVNKIDEVKQIYGDRLTLWTGVTAELFNRGTPDDIKREARFAIEHCGPGGGFILASTHSIMVGAKYANFMAMVEAAHQSGK